MDEYTLYLDESKNSEKTIFVIGGIIIKNSEIAKLNLAINDAKKCIWAGKKNVSVVEGITLEAPDEALNYFENLLKMKNLKLRYWIWEKYRSMIREEFFIIIFILKDCHISVGLSRHFIT